MDTGQLAKLETTPTRELRKFYYEGEKNALCND